MKKKIFDDLNKYNKLLERAVKDCLKIKVPSYPENINIISRIKFMEELLIANDFANVEKELWEKHGKILTKPYFNEMRKYINEHICSDELNKNKK